LTNSGKVFIGAFNPLTPPTSPLTVAGVIETNGSAGGIKFPDGSIQTSAMATITGVTAGEGLTGGGATGNVTLGVTAGGIKPSMLADEAVTETKLGPKAVTAGKIAPGVVASEHLAAGAVTAAQIALGAVSSEQIGQEAVLSKHIAQEAVLSKHIAQEAVISKHSA